MYSSAVAGGRCCKAPFLFLSLGRILGSPASILCRCLRWVLPCFRQSSFRSRYRSAAPGSNSVEHRPIWPSEVSISRRIRPNLFQTRSTSVGPRFGRHWSKLPHSLQIGSDSDRFGAEFGRLRPDSALARVRRVLDGISTQFCVDFDRFFDDVAKTLYEVGQTCAGWGGGARDIYSGTFLSNIA